MSTSTTPPPIPSAFIPPGFVGGAIPNGDAPEDRIPISGAVGAVEALLRHPRRIAYHLHQPNSGALIAALLAIAVICSLVYGVVIGTFSGDNQLWIAPVKI